MRNCLECTRLWSAYAKATDEYFRLDGKLEIAGLSREHATVQHIQPLKEKAARDRAQVRAEIAAHEHAVHQGASR